MDSRFRHIFLFFILCLISAEEVYPQGLTPQDHTLTWNDEYWLIPWHVRKEGLPPELQPNYLLKFDGEKFEKLAEAYSIRTYWNGKHWLILLGKEDYRFPDLLLYDGKNFTQLKQMLEVHEVVWNGNYWLISVGEFKENEWQAKLIKYDGNVLTDIIVPNFTSIQKIVWNGEYWLAGGFKQIGEGLGATYIARLIKYNGSEFVETGVGEYNFSNFYEVLWNGEYWLIHAQDPMGSPTILRYDGEKFHEVTPYLDADRINQIELGDKHWLIIGSKNRSELRILRYDGENLESLSRFFLGAKETTFTEWNGEYWLIGSDNGKVKKYDGYKVAEVPVNLEKSEAAYFARWNGKYWLIWTSAKEKGEPYSRWERLLKFDGNETKDLTKFLAPGSKPIRLEDLNWNGKYWLIKGSEVALDKPFGRAFLFKFDGAAFTDLTPELRKTLGEEFILPTQTPEPIVVKPTKPDERFPANYRNIGVALIAFLVVTSYLLWKKRKSW